MKGAPTVLSTYALYVTMLIALLSQLPALALALLAAYIFRRYDRARRAADSGSAADLQRIKEQHGEAVQQVAQTQQRALEQVVRRMQQLEKTQEVHAKAIEQLTAQLAHHKTALEQLGQVVQQGFTRLDTVADTLRSHHAVGGNAARQTGSNERSWTPTDSGN